MNSCPEKTSRENWLLRVGVEEGRDEAAGQQVRPEREGGELLARRGRGPRARREPLLDAHAFVPVRIRVPRGVGASFLDVRPSRHVGATSTRVEAFLVQEYFDAASYVLPSASSITGSFMISHLRVAVTPVEQHPRRGLGTKSDTRSRKESRRRLCGNQRFEATLPPV